MNKKEWEAIQNASKVSKGIADFYKTVPSETLTAASKAATFANPVKTNLELGRNSMIEKALGATRMSVPSLASEGASAQIAKLDTSAWGSVTKQMSNMLGFAKFDMPGTEVMGAATMVAKMKPQLFGFADSLITNMLNSTRVSIPSFASVGASAMLKEVQPSLAVSTNQAILNLVNGVKAGASTNYGAKISSAIAPDLTKGAFKGVAHLLGGAQSDKSAFFQSAASISKAFEPNLTENALKGVSGILREMSTEPFMTSNSAVSAITKSLGFQKLQSSANAASISMDDMASVLKSLQEYQDSIADLCQVNIDEILEDIELMDSDVGKKQENQPQTEPLFTNEEFNEALDESINDTKSFQIRVATWAEEKKKKYCVVIWVLRVFIALFIMPYLQEKVGLPVMTQVMSSVKELPEKASRVLDKLEKGVEALITENTNYYYKVTYIDENGEVKEGYVAKRNLKIIEEQEANTDEETSEEINEE